MDEPEKSPFSHTVGSIVWRGIFSLALFIAYGIVNGILYPATTLATGKLAGGQFANDDAGYLIATYGMNFFSSIGWPFYAFLLIMLWVWWSPGKAAVIKFMEIMAVAALLLTIGTPTPGQAYYDKTDWPEIYYVLPNESAFFVPDVGANKDAQTKFMSEQYLNENKIAAKRFQIPHAKVVGSSYTLDFYGPAGRLIIVDRTPYAREWTADASRGTSKTDQALGCQSSEGLNISVDIAISAAVFEEDAPKFLYRFGVKPPVGDRTTDTVKFASVYYGKSLTEVMDTVIHGKISTLVCGFFSDKSLDQINKEMKSIFIEAEKETATYLKTNFGITLDYLGLAGSPTFGGSVQKAIDDRYAADRLAPVLSVLERQTEIKVKEGLADALRGFGKGMEAHGLPNNMLLLPSSSEVASALTGAAATAAGLNVAPTAPAKPATAPSGIRVTPTVPSQP